ncbi:MAG: histidinol-phosphatase, partial [Bacteroidota bacterium]
MKKLLILDRDGTIIVEPPEDYQVDSLEKLAFLPGVIGQLIKINAAHDFEWVMVTNQDGLGTEVYPEETFWPPHQKMMDLLEGEGIHFSEVIIDRTFKKDGAPTRKPGTALLTKYLEGEYDLANSFVIGDRLSDIKLAQNLGAKGILIGRSADTIDDDYTAEELVDTLVLEAQHWAEISAFMSRNAISRAAVVERKTQETDIRVAVNLDGTGQGDHQTGIGFFDHMLDQ